MNLFSFPLIMPHLLILSKEWIREWDSIWYTNKITKWFKFIALKHMDNVLYLSYSIAFSELTTCFTTQNNEYIIKDNSLESQVISM